MGALANWYFKNKIEQEQKQKELDKYNTLLGAAPILDRSLPQQGPTRPGEFLRPLENVVTQGSGLLGNLPPVPRGTVSPQEALLRTAGMENLGPNFVNAFKQLGAGGIKYKDVKINPLTGQAHGLNEATGTYEPIPTSAPFPKGQTVQGVDEQGRPTQELVFPSLMPKPKEGRITVSKKGFKPLPTPAQDSFSQAFDAFDALDIMKKNVGESGVIEGRYSKTQAALGFNQKAIDFNTAKNNMKLAAQALIKGIPSNFDVQTVINTLPDLSLPEPVNESREQFSRNLLKNLVRRTIAFYKGTGYNIPNDVLSEAKKRGVNIGDVKPWDGQGDPLEGVAEEAKDKDYFKKKYGLD